MGDVRKASFQEEKIFEERALANVQRRFEERHGRIKNADDYDAFLDANEFEIDNERIELMMEAGLE